MSRLRLLIVSFVTIVFLSTSISVSAQEPDPPDKPTHSGTVTKTNGIYNIYVEDVGSGIGTYTISTGANHPVTLETGSSQNVLFGGQWGSPSTSFNTIRSYSTSTDYVTSPSHSSNFTVVDLDTYSPATTFFGDHGIRTTWILPGPPATPDRLDIIQDVEILGSNFADSVVRVTIRVTNPNFSSVDVGVRYLWDFQIGLDDGPIFSQLNPSGSALTRETEFRPPVFLSYQIQDNDRNLDPPIFGVNGSAVPSPGQNTTVPGVLQYVCWRDAFLTAFDYSVDPDKDIATTSSATCSGYSGGDSAVSYLFGPDSASALTIGSNETLTVVADIYATSDDSDGDGLYDFWEMYDTDLNGDGVIDIGPSVGADPNRKDIYVEVDWMEEDENHSHYPIPGVMQEIVSAFAAHDINLHIDAGPNSIDYVTQNAWGQHSKGNAIAHNDTLAFVEWHSVRQENFGHSDKVYRHAIFAHKAKDPKGKSILGYGQIQYILVALGSKKDGVGTLNEQAGTFMHELGHTLDLWHGGSEDQKSDAFHHKPNYLSVMNYNFTTSGLIINGTDGHFDYSNFDLPDLDEASLSEVDGLGDDRVSDYSTKYNISLPWACYFGGQSSSSLGSVFVVAPYKPIDWNCNNVIDTGTVNNIDINGHGGNGQTLTGWDDWANLNFFMGNIGKLGDLEPIPITDYHDELTEEQDLQIQRISDPRVQLSNTVDVSSVQPGGAVTYTITIFNIDAQDINGVVVTDTLPTGFSYVTGTTSGATAADPVINGQDLSWSSFVVPGNGGELTLTFQATVSQVPGIYSNNVSGSSSNGYVVPTGDTAEVEVLSAPTACTPSNSYGQSGSGYHLASLNSAPLLANFERLPLSFVPNRGQEDQAVKFNAKGLGGNLFFTPGEVVFSLPNPVKVKEKEDEKEKIRYDLRPANVVRIHYQGANEDPEVVPIGQLPGVVNVLKGNNASKWRTNLPTYSGIAYRELYPGVELRYEGTDGTLKSTFHVAPGADPSAIVWRYKGVDSLSTDESGNLVVNLPEPAGNGAVLIEQAPVAWQVVNDHRVMVAVQYAVEKNDKKVSFAFPDGYDPALPLVIDPTITYSTYLGGGKTDEAHGITVDADCNMYVTGATSSSNFPTVNPFQTNQPTKDIFISKINAAGDTLLYSTYLGGNESDEAWGIALDSQGHITIVGESESSDFPMQNAYNSTFAGGICSDGEPCDDVVVVQLTPDGTALRYSTYLGGTQEDDGLALAIGPGDLIHFTGATRSSAFPTKNAYQSSFGGGTCSSTPCYDAFVATIDPALSGSASLLYSTFLGGSDYDDGMGIAVDSLGHVYVAGYTRSSSFPTRDAYQATRAGGADAFLTKLDTTLSGDTSLLYSTFLGGSTHDRAYGIALQGIDQVYLTGWTRSANFPLANAFDNTFGGGTCGSSPCKDAYVTYLDIASNTLVSSSYLGGSNEEEGAGITVDSSGNAYVTGYTRSTDFPTVAAIQASKGADSCGSPPCSDAFITKVSAAGTLTYSTYLGGSWEDYGNAILVDGLGNTYIVGYTFSSNFPTTPGSFPYVGGSGYSDAFVVKIDD